MSTLMETVLYIGAFLHLVCMVLNFGFILAYLQRSDILRAETQAFRHLLYALLYSVPGFLGLFFILGTVRFPNYGIKFYLGEHPHLSERWYKELRESQLHHQHAHTFHTKYHERSPAGNCVDIWR